jgi:hypothetical protein
MPTWIVVSLYLLTFSWMERLAPGHESPDLAWAIAEVSSTEDPLFKDDRVRTAALLTAVAFRESAFDPKAVGDSGHSVCAFQVYDGPPLLLESPLACTAHAYRMLRESIHIDRLHPIAFYARGPRSETEEAQRISGDRMAIAERLAGPR